MKFKKGDRVYSYTHGWGEIESLVSVSAWIEYDSGLLRFTNTKFISFTEYDLESGGFSQERPEPKLEVGKSYRLKKGPCVVICKRNKYNSYGIQADKWSNEIKCSVPEDWKEIPESEVIALLEKECVRWGGVNWKGVNIKECLSNPNYINSNKGLCSIRINISEIWNKNGCIFKDGVWAEKLESQIEEGQMIWVKDDDSAWTYLEFNTYPDENDSTIDYWDEYSIINPYPGSIEARAIELLRGVMSGDGKNADIFGKAWEFLDEIESYKNQN